MDIAFANRISIWSHLPDIVESGHKKALHQTDPLIRWENIFSLEWDLCVVIDACRYDLFESISGEYDYIKETTPFTSADSMTPRWMERTFVDSYRDELANTTYVCGNPFGERWVNKSLVGQYCLRF